MKNIRTSIAARALLGLGVLTGLASLHPAHAQNAILPVRVKLGAVAASGSDTKDAAGSLAPAAEVEVKLPSLFSGATITAGIQQGSKDGGRLRTIPITLSKTFSPPNPVSGVTGYPYFGVGAGAYILNGHQSGDDSKSKTTLGGFAQAGYQFPNSFFVEAKYQVAAGKVDGLSANGLAVFIGRAF